MAVEVDHTGVESAFASLFEHYRNLGQDCDPSSLLPPLVAQTNAIQEFAKITESHTSRKLLSLGSRYAEYTGWLAQETGNDLAALRWTRRAVDLAEAAGDVNFAAYGFVRHGLVTMYRGEAMQTTQLAGRAQASSLPPRIRGLAAAREAQGHAIAADYDSAMRALDRARTLLSTDGGSEQSITGSRNLADQAEMTRGWCLYDLGRPGDAAAVIGQQMANKPEKVAENIEVLTRLADAADTSAESSAGRARRYGAAEQGDSTAMTAAAPSLTTAERFDAFLDSFGFPGGDARLLVTKQVADWVEAHGFRAAAREMTSPYDVWPGEGDLLSPDDGPRSADG